MYVPLWIFVYPLFRNIYFIASLSQMMLWKTNYLMIQNGKAKVQIHLIIQKGWGEVLTQKINFLKQ